MAASPRLTGIRRSTTRFIDSEFFHIFSFECGKVFATLLRNGCFFLLVQKEAKKTPGADSGEHLACGGAHSHLAPKPLITGDALL